jgi:hypothetical protein
LALRQVNENKRLRKGKLERRNREAEMACGYVITSTGNCSEKHNLLIKKRSLELTQIFISIGLIRMLCFSDNNREVNTLGEPLTHRIYIQNFIMYTSTGIHEPRRLPYLGHLSDTWTLVK